MKHVCAQCGSDRIKGISYEVSPVQDVPGLTKKAQIHRRAMWALIVGPVAWVAWFAVNYWTVGLVTKHFDANGNYIQR
jgi:hypothetical protein